MPKDGDPCRYGDHSGYGDRDGDHPRESDRPKDGDTLRICLAAFYDVAQPCIRWVLPTKPFYKLTGTDRQTGRQADRQTNLGIGRHAPPKMKKMSK